MDFKKIPCRKDLKGVWYPVHKWPLHGRKVIEGREVLVFKDQKRSHAYWYAAIEDTIEISEEEQLAYRTERRIQKESLKQSKDQYTKKLNEIKKSLPRTVWNKDDLNNEIVLDIETTGGYDPEILEISIYDLTGKLLYFNRFKPACHLRWAIGEYIHGISPEDVKNAQCVLDCFDEINSVIQSARLITGYGLSSDVRFLKSIGIVPNPSCQLVDTAELFWRLFPSLSGTVSLVRATAIIGYVWTAPAHSSKGDALAALEIYHYLKAMNAIEPWNPKHKQEPPRKLTPEERVVRRREKRKRQRERKREKKLEKTLIAR